MSENHDHDGHDDPNHDGHDEHNHDGHDEHDPGDHGGHGRHGDHDHSEHGDHDHDGHHAHDLDALSFAAVTVSSSRSLDADPSGDAVVELAESAGHEVRARELVADDRGTIRSVVDELVSREDVDVIVTTGGTGVTPDDVTPEAVTPLFDKPLPGFGELFRRLSYEEIGSMVVATRAVAGIAAGVPVFCLPGSENAVRLGVGDIVLEQAGHLAGLARRD